MVELERRDGGWDRWPTGGGRRGNSHFRFRVGLVVRHKGTTELDIKPGQVSIHYIDHSVQFSQVQECSSVCSTTVVAKHIVSRHTGTTTWAHILEVDLHTFTSNTPTSQRRAELEEKYGELGHLEHCKMLREVDKLLQSC